MSNGTALQIRRGAGRAATGFLVHAVRRACPAARVAARVAPMGLTSLKVRLSNPRDRRLAVEEELLVDSGAIYADREGASKVIFGRRGDARLIGAVALEELGLMLDPLKRRLRPLRLMLA